MTKNGDNDARIGFVMQELNRATDLWGASRDVIKMQKEAILTDLASPPHTFTEKSVAISTDVDWNSATDFPAFYGQIDGENVSSGTLTFVMNQRPSMKPIIRVAAVGYGERLEFALGDIEDIENDQILVYVYMEERGIYTWVEYEF